MKDYSKYKYIGSQSFHDSRKTKLVLQIHYTVIMCHLTLEWSYENVFPCKPQIFCKIV